MRPPQTPIALSLAALASASLWKRADPSSDAAFNWTAITPSETLDYHECYGGYQCARLKVPLDWTEVQDGAGSGRSNVTSDRSNITNWAAIAILKVPAVVNETDPSFGGPILIKPGGPSGSGTEFALSTGEYLQSLTDGEKHYEILGFDPRGVGFSTPSADCYRSNLNRDLDYIQQAPLSPLRPNNDAFKSFFQIMKGRSNLCAEAGPGSIFEHMTTAAVARDMLEIAERSAVAVAAKKGKRNSKCTKAKVQYIGLSYGTYLGNSFASMFPDRVGRIVLDGVVDPDAYIGGFANGILDDSETIVDHFYDTCFAGGDGCPLRQQGDKSGADIRARVDAFIDTLDKAPLSVVYNGRSRLITSFLVRDAVRQAFYSPLKLFEPVSQLLAELLQGGHSLLFPMFGDPWARNVLGCSHWPFKPKFAFHGPFGSPRSPNRRSDKKVDNSTAPLLILSNRYDNATPLKNARKVAESFAGSSLVVQEAWGHCALVVSSSKCVAKIIQEYFNNGTVPQTDTVCQPDCLPGIPFKPCPGFSE